MYRAQTIVILGGGVVCGLNYHILHKMYNQVMRPPPEVTIVCARYVLCKLIQSTILV